MTPQEYCQQKAAPRGTSLYYALYFADPARRPALLATYAYRREIMDIVPGCSDRAVAQAKLGWWKQELARAVDGAGSHPVAQALAAQVIGRYKLAQDYLEQVIEGVEMDLEYGLYPSFKELSIYCHRVGGSVTHLMVEICGYRDVDTARYAHDLGMALQLMRLLCNVRRDVDANRIYLPEDEMQRCGVDRDDLRPRHTSEPVRALFALQAERIRSFLDQALARLPEQDREAQRPGVILARLQRGLLDEIEREGFPLLERGFDLTPIRKLWIAWRTARHLSSKRGPHAS